MNYVILYNMMTFFLFVVTPNPNKMPTVPKLVGQGRYVFACFKHQKLLLVWNLFDREDCFIPPLAGS